MDSEDSRTGGKDGSSSSDSSSESGSPRRRSTASSPASLNRKSPKSDRNSPDPYWRSNSPKHKVSEPRSPSPDSGDDSPARRRTARPRTPDAPRSPGSDTNQTSRSKWSTKSELGSRLPSISLPGSPKSQGSNSRNSPIHKRRSPPSPRSPQNASRDRPSLIRSPGSPKIRSPNSSRHSSPRSLSPKRTTRRSPSSRRSSETRSPRGPRSPSSRDASPRSLHPRHNRSPHSPRRHSSPESPPRAGRSRSNSSRSSRGSSPRRITSRDPPTEEISDGEMDFEHDKPNNDDEHGKDDAKDFSRDKDVNNISHEDLSDVSDLESIGQASDDERKPSPKSPTRAPDESSNHSGSPLSEKAVKNKLNGNVTKKSSSPPTIYANGSNNGDSTKLNKILEKTSKTEDVEEQLDFEAEEGECIEAPVPKQNNADKHSDAGKKEEGEEGGASSLEEGEVSDEEERRPEETEPRPVCRFYSRGQCTWGVSCRFLHPGVTDKGNYTMFDMVRTMPPGYGGPPMHHPPHAVHALHSQHAAPASAPSHQMVRESAWERGLRTAKEMMRQATKRKEQDSDFEEKKMHLSLAGSGRGGSLGPDEDDPELAAYAGYPPASPTHAAAPHHPGLVSKREREREEYYRQAERRAIYEEVPRGYAKERVRYSRAEVPAHEDSPPPYYDKLPAEHPHHKSGVKLKKTRRGCRAGRLLKLLQRRGRTTREVIVQRARVETARGDEWADPWMRGGKRGQGAGGGGGGGGGEKRRRGKYSSASSYSSSSSSDSSSRSSSRSRRSSGGRYRRPAKSPTTRQRSGRAALSPSVIVQERRAATARAQAMNPPAPSSRKRPPSPAASRQHASNPPPPPKVKGVDAFGRTKPSKVRNRKRYSKSSSSGSDSSSSSSDSDSDSRSSSSSGSSVPPVSSANARSGAPAVVPPSTRQIRQETKTSVAVQKKEIDGKESLAKKRVATSPIGNAAPAKKPVSRREELLKQLKAVEDAIARKRSKV